ncbi:unnamed protein product, partial [Polarella glacialis]
PSLVIDVCGGHGALGMLFIAHGVTKKALIIDQLRPPSHEAVKRAWAPFLGGGDSVSYDARPLREALPEALASVSGESVFVVACHACQHLAREIIDFCLNELLSTVTFAVCPCCPKDSAGGIQAAANSLGVDFGAAMFLAEMGRVSDQCEVHHRSFDAEVSPQNRILLGRAPTGLPT